MKDALAILRRAAAGTPVGAAPPVAAAAPQLRTVRLTTGLRRDSVSALASLIRGSGQAWVRSLSRSADSSTAAGAEAAGIAGMIHNSKPKNRNILLLRQDSSNRLCYPLPEDLIKHANSTSEPLTSDLGVLLRQVVCRAADGAPRRQRARRSPRVAAGILADTVRTNGESQACLPAGKAARAPAC